MEYAELYEKKLEGETLFTGKVITLEVDKVELVNGHTSVREVARHSGGVAVLALSENQEVTLVKQFRYPMDQVILELPAGKLDKNPQGEEDPLLGAKRELEEETGIIAQKYTYLGYVLASPGFCDEVLHMYLAENLSQVEAKPDEDEFLHIVTMPFDQVVAQIMSGEIVDGKTVSAVLKAKLHLGI